MTARFCFLPRAAEGIKITRHRSRPSAEPRALSGGIIVLFRGVAEWSLAAPSLRPSTRTLASSFARSYVCYCTRARTHTHTHIHTLQTHTRRLRFRRHDDPIRSAVLVPWTACRSSSGGRWVVSGAQPVVMARESASAPIHALAPVQQPANPRGPSRPRAFCAAHPAIILYVTAAVVTRTRTTNAHAVRRRNRPIIKIIINIFSSFIVLY